jgi:hypothetical protein
MTRFNNLVPAKLTLQDLLEGELQELLQALGLELMASFTGENRNLRHIARELFLGPRFHDTVNISVIKQMRSMVWAVDRDSHWLVFLGEVDLNETAKECWRATDCESILTDCTNVRLGHTGQSLREVSYMINTYLRVSSKILTVVFANC